MKMQRDWDERAAKNARFYVGTAQEEWSDEEFFASGEKDVQAQILTDMTNICRGKHPSKMRVLEIGCGAGRVTRALGAVFGEVYAVDVSGEMVRLARHAVRELENVFIYRNNGADLSVIPVDGFDFAFSHLVFQHIPSREVIESYVREVYRVLRPGALFKFQVQGETKVEVEPGDTWVGVPFSELEVFGLANQSGFEYRYRSGAGEQSFWNWFFKPTVGRGVSTRRWGK